MFALLLNLHFVELGLEHPQRLISISMLGALVLTGCHNSGGEVSQTNRRLGFVNVLPARTRRAVGVHF